MKLPKHIGLHLCHNEHNLYYETVAEAVNGTYGAYRHCAWKNKDAMDRAIATNEAWTMQWYPITPIGSHTIAAPTFEELLAWAEELDPVSTDVAL